MASPAATVLLLFPDPVSPPRSSPIICDCTMRLGDATSITSTCQNLHSPIPEYGRNTTSHGRAAFSKDCSLMPPVPCISSTSWSLVIPAHQSNHYEKSKSSLDQPFQGANEPPPTCTRDTRIHLFFFSIVDRPF